jgi:hypothetical protein
MKIPWRLKEQIENRKNTLVLDLANFDKKIKNAQLLIEDLQDEKERTIKELNELMEFVKEVEE